MDIRNRLRKPLVAVALTLLAVAAAGALDLPIKRVNGKEYYYYEVQSKETIFGLTKKLGISRNEIILHNPTVADGLRSGQVLYFPVDATEPGPASAPESLQSKAAPAAATTAGGDGSTMVHRVSKGETVYGVARQYGIGEDELLSLNPAAAQGLKPGMILTLPEPPATASSAASEAGAQPQEHPCKAGPTVYVGQEPQAVEGPETVDINPFERTPLGESLKSSTDEVDTVRIAVMLPFQLDAEKPSKQALHYTDFFRGLLLAADSIKGLHNKFIISAYDTGDSPAVTDSLLKQPGMELTDLVIAPDGEAQLASIAAWADRNCIKVLNVFAVKDNSYINNPYVLQANIPHSDMYSQAVDELMRTFHDYQPVMLVPAQGKTDKIEFVKTLRKRLEQAGRPYVDVEYEGMLHLADLQERLDTAQRYLFVPASGTSTEFSRIIGALKGYKELLSDYGRAMLFGYPEWITFRSDQMDNIHFMNSTIYSRFFNDADSYRSKNLVARWNATYASPMLNSVPVQGVLGFDTGMYLLHELDRNLLNSEDFEGCYQGVQNDYHFTSPDNVKGKVNTALYFINFRPSGIIDRRSL